MAGIWFPYGGVAPDAADADGGTKREVLLIKGLLSGSAGEQVSFFSVENRAHMVKAHGIMTVASEFLQKNVFPGDC